MILQSLEKFRDVGFLIMRIGVGAAFVFVHGMGKFFAGPERWEKLGGNLSIFGVEFLPVFWGFMAAFSEFAGGILIIIGLLFRPALFLLIITMIVAAATHINAGDPLGRIAAPAVYAFIFVGLLFTGPGKISLDYLLTKKKR
jgi:putative oxidoreductase